MDYTHLFEENLALIDGVIASVCRRGGLSGADAEDFASIAKLALIENDYAILRPFEGRSSLSTFLVIVIHRLLLDERTRERGRWHASREAERFGAAGIALERVVRRERRTVEEALPIVQAIDPTLTRDEVLKMESRLPIRAPRPRAVQLSADEEHVAAGESTDARAFATYAQQLSDRTSAVMRGALAAMSLEDRMIVRFHFGSSFPVSEIAALLRLPQRPLYRRVERLLRQLRAALAAEGIEASDAAELIGCATRELDFGLANGKPADARQTNHHDTSRSVEEAE
jgi:RNA polymerase sigma factor for flagellar operon FliA